MEFMVNGRNLTVSDRFREYAAEKISKLEPLTDRAQRVDAKVSQQPNARVADTQLKVEITVIGRGPVIRAEAQAADKFAAFDAAYSKLLERLRRAKDKRKIHHGRHTPKAVSEVTAGLDAPLAGSAAGPLLGSSDDPQELIAADAQRPYDLDQDLPAGDSPVLIRRKVFPAAVMNVDDAVDNMELVGHDFYLFIDAETKAPSVVYRRRGWRYGVISLDEECPDSDSAPADQIRAYRSDDRAAIV